MNVHDPNLRSWTYDAIIGTGGVGTGKFFALQGTHTLGREESRGGRYLDRRDYCKLHIILHYVKTLRGPHLKTLPLGGVGDDPAGHELMEEMGKTGMDLSLMRVFPGEQTLDCICLLYPDGSGGNLTVTDSASSLLSKADVQRAGSWFETYAGRGMALAVPEVPLAIRADLLALAGPAGFFRAGSFTSEEIRTMKGLDAFCDLDLVALNLDEASNLMGVERGAGEERVIEQVAEILGARKPGLGISITAGSRGSWILHGKQRQFLPAPKVAVESAAGAGDAHLAGILAGLAGGCSLSEAHHLGILAGAFSVTSPHTIHPGLDRRSLHDFARSLSMRLPSTVERFLASKDTSP